MARSGRRTCVGCRSVRELPALIRITADAAGNLVVNPRRAAGRGAYLCPSLQCLAEAWRRQVFPRALRRRLPAADEAAVRERFGVELRRRGLAPPAAPASGQSGGGSRRLTPGRRYEVSAPPEVGEEGSGEGFHRQQMRRPSGGWDGRR